MGLSLHASVKTTTKMDHNKRPPLDPTAKRLGTETLAHTNEARRLIADLAKSRGVTLEPQPTGFEDIAEEITGMHKEVAALAKAERERAREPSGVHVYLDKSDSESPGEAMSVRGPGGIGLRRAPAWLILAVAIVAAVAYVVGQIATHPKPESVPVTAPVHAEHESAASTRPKPTVSIRD
jgi:hypothetical protein